MGSAKNPEEMSGRGAEGPGRGCSSVLMSADIQALNVTHGLNHPYTQDHRHPDTFRGHLPGMARDTNHPGFTFHHESTAPFG